MRLYRNRLLPGSTVTDQCGFESCQARTPRETTMNGTLMFVLAVIGIIALVAVFTPII